MHVRAPGKINVYLAVGPRHEDGYHSLATVFQAVSLYEDVIATPADDFTMSVTGITEGVPCDDRNLAIRAARLVAAAADYRGGVHLAVHKSVPVAGGMGGGSADAAAALIACDTLWGTQLGPARLNELAARLGADVPFVLHGGTAVGSGRGDHLNPALTRGPFHWVLIASDEGLSTPAVYSRLDELRAAAGEGLADDAQESLDVPLPVLQALRAGDARDLAACLHNDLERAACDERPELGALIQAGIAAGALNGLVSGSGPTVALLCEDADAADAVAATMDASGFDAFAVETPAHGARIITS